MMTLSPEKKIAIQALVLGSKSQESATQFVASMSFIFREIKKLDVAMAKGYQTAAKRVQKREPNLDEDEVYSKVFSHKPFVIRFIKNENRKAIFYQFLILQVSGWLKSSYKMHSSTLARYSRRRPHKWGEKFLEVGPRHQNFPWAETINVASNYVRHKEEWHFNSIDIDPITRKIIRRTNIINTLEGDLPKKNARYLLRLGVSEDVLFGSLRDAAVEVLELAKSDTPVGLKANCEAWLTALNSFVQRELFKLL